MSWPSWARALGLAVCGWAAATGSASAEEFRVCADPNNLPFSDRSGAGFENKLADMVARDLGQKVAYTWHAQRRGFIRETLKAKACDVIMGVPSALDMVETTRPYYRSQYMFVTRTDARLDVTSLDDPRLRRLRIGVHLIGDDGANTPPADALASKGIVHNIEGYMIYGDYRRAAPPARLLDAVADGDVQIAAVWGPLAGYFAARSAVPLRLTPITGTAAFAPLAFAFDIAVGVRHGDDDRRDQIDRILVRRQAEIHSLLDAYGVPQIPVVGDEGTKPDDD